MYPVVWWLIWITVFVFPTTGRLIKNRGRYLILGLLGAFFGAIAISASVIDVYMILWLVFFKLALATMEWFFVYVNVYRLSAVEERPMYEKSESRRASSFFGVGERRAEYRWLAGLGLIILVLFSSIMLWQTQAASRVNNASFFDGLLTFQPAEASLFQNEIPNNMLRLTTEELAKSIALRSAAHFGSIRVGPAHITIYKERLVWVVAMLPPNLYGDNTVKGFVIVDANNPELDVEIIDLNFKVGEQLLFLPPFYTGDIQGNAYWGISTADAYGRATLTADATGNWKYVLTATEVQPLSFIAQAKGVYVYNAGGQTEGYYGLDQTPEWVTQRFDEGWLKNMISLWGATRRGDTFDLFASGFLWIPASTNRVEISDDARWIVDPDTNRIAALVPVDYVGEVQTMAGMFKIADDKLEYFDTTGLDIKSGLQAQNVVESHILLPTSGTYEAQMPLIYPLNGENAWFVPIYWRTFQGESTSEQETIKLAGLGIVDAVDLDHYAIVMTGEGYQGEALVAETKRRFTLGVIQPSNEKTVSGLLTDKFSYVQNGNTVYVLTINQTDYAAFTQTLDFTIVSRIEKLSVGSTTTIVVNSNNNEFIRFQP